MDVATQLLTMAAVVLGSGTTYAANWLMDQKDRKEQLKSRWDVRKLDVYAEFIGSSRVRIAGAVMLYEHREGLRIHQKSVADLQWELAVLGQNQAAAFERLMLVGGDAVVEAAHEVQEAVAAVAWLAMEQIEGTIEDWRDRNRSAFAAINRFHQFARADLGVAGQFEGEQHSARGLLLPPARTSAVEPDD